MFLGPVGQLVRSQAALPPPPPLTDGGGAPAAAPGSPEYRAAVQAAARELFGDRVVSDVYNNGPFGRGPNELDTYGNETPEMRRAYLDLYAKEPAVKAAVRGKVCKVAGLDVSVLPGEKDDPRALEAAEAFKWAVEGSAHGWDGLIEGALTPALLLGFSVGEVTLEEPEPTRKWGEKSRLRHVRPLDTSRIRLQLDQYRNVLGVVNQVRGMEMYPRAKVLVLTHQPLFHNPFGRSEVRAAYRSAGMIADAYRLWFVALKMAGTPYMHGKVKNPTNRQRMEATLEAMRAGGWCVTGPDDEIALIDLASAMAAEGYEAAVRTHREDIFLAVRGAYLPFLEGSGGADSHGDTEVAQGNADADTRLTAKAVGRAISRQVVPGWMGANYPGVPHPRAVLGGNDWAETQAQLDTAKKVIDLGLPVSRKYVYEVSQIPPPDGADDAVGGRPPGPGQPPGGEGGPPPAGGGGDGAGARTPPPPEPAPQPPAAMSDGIVGPLSAPPPPPVPGASGGVFAAAFSAAAAPHRFATVYVPLAGAVADYLRGEAAAIPDAALADRGREDEPHVTVRHGLHADDPAAAARVLAGAGPVAMRFGRPAVFRGAASGRPYDVIHLPVESPDLHRLHAALGILPHTDSFPDYRPHATVAYVRAGLGDQLARRMGYPRTPLAATADHAVFSGRDRAKAVIQLGPPATFSDGGVATPFAPGDAPRYARYFAPDDAGHYPGGMHRLFGLSLKGFADATGLARRHAGGRWAWAPGPKPEPAVEVGPPDAPPDDHDETPKVDDLTGMPREGDECDLDDDDERIIDEMNGLRPPPPPPAAPAGA